MNSAALETEAGASQTPADSAAALETEAGLTAATTEALLTELLRRVPWGRLWTAMITPCSLHFEPLPRLLHLLGVVEDLEGLESARADPVVSRAEGTWRRRIDGSLFLSPRG